MAIVSESQGQIASFERPPVVEVVASVQFGGLSDAGIFSVGNYWRENLREEFPEFSLQAPYDVPEEKFHGPQPPSANLQFGGRPPLPRLWLSAQPGQPGDLVQIQQDWFALNWRKVLPHDRYDRWPQRRDAFERHWTALVAWAGRLGDRLSPRQFEVTYINHIVPIDGLWTGHDDVGVVFDGGPPRSVGDRRLEMAGWNADYRVEVDGSPKARTHVSAQPGFRSVPGQPEPQPLVVLEVTCRGQVGSDNVLTCLDLGRESVVNTFLSVTSAKAKKAWGMESK